ncbi:hypothetical protein HPA05_05890 [Streptococcus suis]|nr:hypothetical protein [Streptococcus suis]
MPPKPEAVDTEYPLLPLTAVTAVPSDDVHVLVTGSYVTVTYMALWSVDTDVFAYDVKVR